MVIKRTQLIASGAHSRQRQVLDQAGKRFFKGIVAGSLYSMVLWFPPGGDGGLCGAMNVGSVTNVTVPVARSVMASQRKLR